MHKNTEQLKKTIKKVLKSNGFLIQDIAKRLNLTNRFFSDMQCIKIDRLIDISNATGISLYEFIEDDNFNRYYNNDGKLIKIERK